MLESGCSGVGVGALGGIGRIGGDRFYFGHVGWLGVACALTGAFCGIGGLMDLYFHFICSIFRYCFSARSLLVVSFQERLL